MLLNAIVKALSKLFCPNILKLVLVMQLTGILLLATCLQVSAATYAQKMTIQGENIPLRTVFKDIRKQTGYNFIYANKVLRDARPVTLQEKNAELSHILNAVFKDQPLSYAIEDNLIIVSPKKEKKVIEKVEETVVEEPDRQIAGTVTDDATGDPLVGVTVRIKNSTTGTVTGSDGRFTLGVPEDAVLEVSFVGYTSKEVQIGNNTSLNISLAASATGLDQLVVMGYSEKRKEDLISSVSTVSGKQLNEVTSDDIGSLLQGRAAGVVTSSSSGNPNSQSDITIRGIGSINAGSAPLFVVDGIVGGDFNPVDVESISVLKDAASTALYGSRASNGVIVVTTKSGHAGKSKISFSSSIGFNKPTTGKFKLMNSQQLYDYERSFYPSEELFNDQIPSNKLSQNTNWFKEAFRTALIQNYNLSYSGGNEKTQIYVSGTYYNQEGTLKFNHRKRYNLRINLTEFLSKKVWFDVRVNTDFINSSEDPSGSNGALYGAYLNIPWDNPYNEDGTIKKASLDPQWYGREHENFLYGWQFNLNNNQDFNFGGDFDFHYNITKDLEFSSFNRVNYKKTSNELYYDERTAPGKGIGYLTNGNGLTNSIITSNRLKFSRTFGLNNINALLVGEGEKNKNNPQTVNGQGLAPGLHVMDAASQIVTASGNIGENAFSKGLFQIDYSYGDKYLITGSLIDESSSRFGRKNRSALFYSGALGWIISNENFFNNEQIDLLKFRASFGTTGNAEIGNYQSLGLYSFSSQYAGSPGSTPFQLQNEDLTWEKARKMDLGLDIDLFKRIGFTIDMYDRRTSNLLINVELPFTTGFSSLLKNVGTISNKGIEISLSSKNLVGEFKWVTDFNIAFNKNKVLSLVEGKENLDYGNFRIEVGKDMSSWYMRDWAGVDKNNGDPLWFEDVKNGNTTNDYASAALMFVGKASPDFTGGMRNELSYKNFNLSFFFNFIKGNLVYNNTRTLFDSDGAYYTFNSMQLLPNWSRWANPGDDATHPKPVYGGIKNSNKLSSRFLEDGSYLRMRNITFSYSLPSNNLRALSLDNAEFFVSCDNLFTITSFSGPDPEVSMNLNGGISSLKYPISKSFMFGLKFTF